MTAVAKRQVIAVVGATATGKSTLGIELAKHVGGEVINADSMQLYRGMDVGTAKLSVPERNGVPHHLLDIWDVTTTASVADYQQLARDRIAALHRCGETPVLVGGSGLYLTAVLDEVNFPGTDPQVRAELEVELALEGAPALHRRLAALDPDAAAKILPGNGRKIVRALEVRAVTGSSFVATLDPVPAYPNVVVIGLRVERGALSDRIARRVETMWERGLVAEVASLAERGLREGVTARRALGYAQILSMLDGQLDESTAQERTVTATRRFARRQESWFRRDQRIDWIDGLAPLGQQLDAAIRSVEVAQTG